MVTLGGKVMSKSRGNVVDPLEIIEKYGADTCRTYILFVASPEKELEWNDQGVQGIFRFLHKVASLLEIEEGISNTRDPYILSKTHTIIRDVTHDLESLEHSAAIMKLVEFTNYLAKYRENTSKKAYHDAVQHLLIMLSAFAPHLCEELWEKLGNRPFISLQKWPSFGEKKINPRLDEFDSLVERAYSDVTQVLSLVKIEPSRVKLFIAERWEYPLFTQLYHEKSRNIGELMKKFAGKEHATDIAKIIQGFAKGSIRPIVLTQKEELTIFIEARKQLERDFNLTFEIIKAEESTETKAKQALPGKPALFVC